MIVRRILTAGCLVFFLFTQIFLAFVIFKPLAQPRWYISQTNTIELNDYFQFYKLASLERSQYARKIYDPQVQLKFESDFVKPLKIDKVFYSQNPPIILPLVFPLASFPYHVGYSLWCVSQFVAGMTALFLLALKFSPLARKDQVLLILGVMSSLPAFLALWHGNNVFWIVAALCLYIYGFMKQKNVLGGIGAAIVACKPQHALLMLVPALAKLRWKLITAMICFDMALLAAAGALIGWDNIINYPGIVSTAESTGASKGVNPEHMACIRGLLTHFLPPELNYKAAMAIFFIALLAALAAWLRMRKIDDAKPMLWAIALTIVLDLIVSPHVHFHDCIFLAVAAVITLPTVSLFEAMKLKSSSERVWCFLLLLYPLYSWALNFAFAPSRHQEIEAVILFLLNVAIFLAGAMRMKELLAHISPALSHHHSPAQPGGSASSKE